MLFRSRSEVRPVETPPVRPFGPVSKLPPVMPPARLRRAKAFMSTSGGFSGCGGGGGLGILGDFMHMATRVSKGLRRSVPEPLSRHGHSKAGVGIVI